MIISHHWQFVFLHGRKTAGSSTTAALARYMTPGDIICGPVGDCLRAGVWPPVFDDAAREIFGGALTLAVARRVHGKEHRFAKYLMDRAASRWRRSFRRYNHSHWGFCSAHTTAEDIKRCLGEFRWGRYFKFIIERNPWDRMVSLYHWRTHGMKAARPDFRTFMQAVDSGDPEEHRLCRAHDPFNRDLYRPGDALLVDAIGRMECLHQDLEAICGEIGIPYDGWLPNAKSGIRPLGSKTTNYYDDELDQIVRRRFAWEIATLGYEGPGHPGHRSILPASRH